MDVCFVLYLFCLSTMCVRIPLSSRSIAGVSSSRALPGFTSNHLCAFLIDGCVAMKQQKNGNLGDIEEKSNMIKLKVCDEDFWKQIWFTPRVPILSLVLFLKSSAISLGCKMHPIHGSWYVTVMSLGTAADWRLMSTKPKSSPDPPPQKEQINIWSKK